MTTHPAATPPTAEQVARLRDLLSRASQGGPGRNIRPISKYPVIFAGRSTHVAQILTPKSMPDEQAEANADLIVEGLAALPGLLAALAPAERAEAVPGPVIAAFAAAIDVADGLIERAYGTNKPRDWEEAFSQVVKARSDAGRAKRKTKAAPTRAGALDAAGEDAYPDLTEAEWTKLAALVPEKRRRIISSIAPLIRAALAAGDGQP